MKFQFFIATAVVLAMAACKTPYKATDRPKTATDSTASITDTSSAMKQIASVSHPHLLYFIYHIGFHRNDGDSVALVFAYDKVAIIRIIPGNRWCCFIP